MRRHHHYHGLIVILTAASLPISPAASLLVAQAPAKPAASQAPQAPAGAAPQPAIDSGWPRTYATPSGGDIVVYQPQVASWQNQKHIVAYSAVSYRAKGSEQAALGSMRFEAETGVSLDERLVNLANLRITESNFSTLPRDETREVVAEITKAIPEDDRVIALDRVLANIDKSQIVPKNVEGIKADPPNVFFSTRAAVLVSFDGEPIWSPIEGNDLKFAVNTNWDVFSHEPTKTFYVRNNEMWLKASDLKGPWAAAGTLPASFSKLPADENWKEVKANLPGKRVSASQQPTVFASDQPAELIVLRGDPSYLVVGNTNLLWVTNTESDVFRLGKAGPVYYLVTGRWFTAPDFTGPWTFATPSLPEEFTRIPLEHERSRVLASVPGTPQAVEAILLAQVPQSARVNKNQLQAPEVTYQGAPEFKAIEATTVERAANTDKDIFKIGDAYYLCYQGVWFTATSATGPWQVASSVPTEIYQIPASSPAHHVTYVVIEDDNDNDEWVSFAYGAGYTGMMVAWGCAVWGSGWYYPPYVHYGGLYPIYYPYFPTYGYAASYNPWTGTYGRSAVAYGPYGGIGATARYNPRTGTYARGAGAWGPYGAQGAAQAWNPRTGTYAQTRQGSSIYGSWGSSSVQRGDDWAQTGRVTNRVTGNTTRVTRTDEGAAVSRRGAGPGGGVVAAGEGGNIYAGHDGSVYRRGSGSWEKYENGNWGSVSPPDGQRAAEAQERAKQAGAGTRPVDAGTYGQLERDRSARAEGTQRTRDYGSYRSSGDRSAGSYRAGGGRAGGGGRTGGGRRR